MSNEHLYRHLYLAALTVEEANRMSKADEHITGNNEECLRHASMNIPPKHDIDASVTCGSDLEAVIKLALYISNIPGIPDSSAPPSHRVPAYVQILDQEDAWLLLIRTSALAAFMDIQRASEQAAFVPGEPGGGL